MDPKQIEAAFPKLLDTGYQITSPVDAGHNCVAWAANDTQRWWWPADQFDLGYFWPTGAVSTADLATFVEAFESLGYECCDAVSLDAGFDRIALFVKDQTVSHVARQLPDGQWTSKLGAQQDISHALSAFESSDVYGELAQLMKRLRVS